MDKELIEQIKKDRAECKINLDIGGQKFNTRGLAKWIENIQKYIIADYEDKSNYLEFPDGSKLKTFLIAYKPNNERIMTSIVYEKDIKSAFQLFIETNKNVNIIAISDVTDCHDKNINNY